MINKALFIFKVEESRRVMTRVPEQRLLNSSSLISKQQPPPSLEYRPISRKLVIGGIKHGW